MFLLKSCEPGNMKVINIQRVDYFDVGNNREEGIDFIFNDRGVRWDKYSCQENFEIDKAYIENMFITTIASE